MKIDLIGNLKIFLYCQGDQKLPHQMVQNQTPQAPFREILLAFLQLLCLLQQVSLRASVQFQQPAHVLLLHNHPRWLYDRPDILREPGIAF